MFWIALVVYLLPVAAICLALHIGGFLPAEKTAADAPQLPLPFDR